MLTRQVRRHVLFLGIVAICTLWAAGYVTAALSDPQGGAEAALFIRPLFLLLVASAAWVILETFLRGPATMQAAAPVGEEVGAGATGLADWRRLAVVFSLPLVVLSISLFGFWLSAVAFTVGLARALGEARPAVLGALGLIATATVWMFAALLGSSLPLWPTWIA